VQYLTASKRLRKGSRSHNGHLYAARAADCRQCPLRARCISPTATRRTVLIVDDFPALLRARRKKQRGWDEQYKERYARHRSQVEGVHGRSKAHHGLGRAARRGLDNVQIQAYITAAVMNLKKLAVQGQIHGLFGAIAGHILAILRHMGYRWRTGRLNLPTVAMAA